MSKNQLLQRHYQLACSILLLSLGLMNNPPQVQANPEQSFQNKITHTPNLFAQKFPDNGDPKGRRRGGTSRRDGCPSLKKPVTAIVAGEEKNNKSFLGTTVAEYPTFWVYLPELPTNLSSGEFVLQDEQGHDIYRTPLTLPPKAGIIGVSLPPNSQYALKQNLKYHWFFRVYCGDPQKKPEYFFVDAWLERVALTPQLQQQLKSAKSEEYKIYAANNLWYDTITNLAELRRTRSDTDTLTKDWTSLFKAVDLEELAGAPIVQRYSPQ
ncbi:MAG: DUF928 domain-containing protein [Brasilonema octagenarum HA4186-MV1]|jgi:hypothetical protein|nr:DUF928 domain-containing protein [Brasilonema octagenarum HA4186-MV1]